MKNKISIPKIRAPNGFNLKISYSISNCAVYINLINNKTNKIIGTVSLIKVYKYKIRNVYRTHSLLDKKFRNKGFGTLLYSRAIQYCLENNYIVSSSGSSSDDAVRVWNGKSIRNKFRIVKRIPAWSNRPIWYAYAKVIP